MLRLRKGQIVRWGRYRAKVVGVERHVVRLLVDDPDYMRAFPYGYYVERCRNDISIVSKPRTKLQKAVQAYIDEEFAAMGITQ